jgi:hypothetical protein
MPFADIESVWESNEDFIPVNTGRLPIACR